MTIQTKVFQHFLALSRRERRFRVDTRSVANEIGEEPGKVEAALRSLATRRYVMRVRDMLSGNTWWGLE